MADQLEALLRTKLGFQDADTLEYATSYLLDQETLEDEEGLRSTVVAMMEEEPTDEQSAALDGILQVAAQMRNKDAPPAPAPEPVPSLPAKPSKTAEQLAQEKRAQLLQQYAKIDEDEEYMPGEDQTIPVYKRSRKKLGIPDGIDPLLIKNDNASRVREKQAAQRQADAAKSQAQKDKNKADLAKQKQDAADRKKAAQERARKLERRG